MPPDEKKSRFTMKLNKTSTKLNRVKRDFKSSKIFPYKDRLDRKNTYQAEWL
jgi:hypothetical protein